MTDENYKAEKVCRLYANLMSQRATWESHWREIAERIYPQAREYFNTNWATPGAKRNEFVFDSTASIALNRFASILDSLLTPRNQTWHRLVANDDELGKLREVQLWYEEVNRVLFKYRYAPMANFSSQNQLNFKSLGAFGTGALYIDDLITEPGLRYKNCHLGELFLAENHQGIIDTVIRRFKLTARQFVQKFGERTPDKVRGALEKNSEQEFEIIHYVGPREDIDTNRMDFKGMPWASYYVMPEGKYFLAEGGYNTFPYTPSRYEQAPNEVYGRSPAMDVLPAIKTLNEQKKTMLKQGHRAVDPVLLVHDDGILDTLSLKPGHAVAGGVSRDGRPLVQTLQVGQVQFGKEMMDDERRLINDTFLVTIFQILVETPTMTATEVLERTREKGMLLAPTLGRQQSERLGPQIERELDILSRQGLLPPMPPVLEEAGASFKVEYDSPLSRAQKAEEAAGLMRTIESVIGVANVTGDVTPLDHFNWDVIVPEISDINAVPARWRRGVEEIMAIREQRSQAQQERQMVELAPSMASAVKSMKK